MFEQLYGHASVLDQLQKDIEQKKLPSAILIYGEQYVGRMTTAVEIARLLSCERGGDGDCDCKRCRQQRTLQDPYMMILTSRDHLPEIEAAYDSFKREKNHGTHILFIRSVRLLISQYHSIFLSVCQADKKKLFVLASEIDDDLYQFLSSSIHDEEIEKVINLAKKIVQKCRKLAAGAYKHLPVSYIRMITHWTHETAGDMTRVVIIEGIDEFHEAATNSMLKILEEPPNNVYFILIAKNRNLIIPTILSRVRSYYEGERSEECEGTIIEQVYHDDADAYDSLKTFFAAKHGIDCRRIREQAEDFLFTALSRRMISRIGIEKIITDIIKKEQMKMFFTEIAAVLEEEVEDGYISADVAEIIMHTMADLLHKSVTYHQADALLMETLYYRIAELI